MKKKRYPEEQIVRILGEIAGGKTVACWTLHSGAHIIQEGRSE